MRGGLVVASALGLQFAIALGTQALLARLLEPAHFGALAFASMAAMAFNALTNVHADKFVIRESGDPHRNLDSAFTLELCLAAVMCLFVCLIAPPLMRWLDQEELTLFVQVLSVSFFYNPLSRPRCLFERELSFFRARFPFIIAQLAAAAVALTLAYLDFGVWSLIAWRLTILALEVAIHWAIAPYRPRLAWKSEVLRRALRFGWPLIGSSLLIFFTYNLDYYIVGQTLEDGTVQLGYYWLAFQVAAQFLKVRDVFQSVLYPIFSRMEDESNRAAIFRKMTRAVGGAFLLPTMVAVFFGRDLILIVFGETWEPSVFPFRIIFLVILTRAIAGNAGYFLYSHGITRWELEASALFLVLLAPMAYVATQRFGIDGTSVSVLVVTLLVTSYSFGVYIRPLAEKGVCYFFLRPWIVGAATLGLALLSDALEIRFAGRLVLFSILLALGYVVVFRGVIGDLRSAGVFQGLAGRLLRP